MRETLFGIGGRGYGRLRRAGRRGRETGLREFSKIAVHNKEEYAAIQAAREAAEAALNGEDQF